MQPYGGMSRRAAKNLAEGHDDHEVWLLLLEEGRECLFLDLLRLPYGQAVGLGPGLDWRRHELLAAASRLVRLRHDADDVAVLVEGRKARHGKLRRAHENDTELLHA